LVGGGYLALRSQSREALVLALLVLSHWLLDALVYRPDLPLTPFARRGLAWACELDNGHVAGRDADLFRRQLALRLKPGYR